MKQNNQQRPTPETSRFMDSLHGYSDSWEQFAQKVEDFSSNLERERDEAMGAVESTQEELNKEIRQRQEKDEQLEAMREAIKEAYDAIQFLCQAASGGMQPANAKMDAIRQGKAALAKLQPLLKP